VAELELYFAKKIQLKSFQNNNSIKASESLIDILNLMFYRHCSFILMILLIIIGNDNNNNIDFYY